MMTTPGGAGDVIKGASRSTFCSALPPQPAHASAQANTNKRLIGVVRMMIASSRISATESGNLIFYAP
jgi:hypothetical protein